jgi:2'-5' RNA ligase
VNQAVELLLDAVCEARVLADWGRLDQAGLASQAQHRGASNRPHVTLAVVPSVPEVAEDALAGACAARLPLEARLGGLAVFGVDPVALVRLVTVSRALADLHAVVADLVEPPADSLTAPGRWTPHLTLARRMPLRQLPEAVRVLGRGEHPMRFTGARRWDATARRTWSLV